MPRARPASSERSRSRKSRSSSPIHSSPPGLTTQVGFTRLAHLKRPKSGRPDFGWSIILRKTFCEEDGLPVISAFTRVFDALCPAMTKWGTITTPLAPRIFLLTRVTRIFQKSVFTKTTPRRPGGTPRRAFCCTDAESARARRISSLQTRRETMTFHKGESGNPAGRPRGSLNRTTVLMQSLLEANAEAIARKAIDLATG